MVGLIVGWRGENTRDPARQMLKKPLRRIRQIFGKLHSRR